jgi:uncharacterized membrane protein
MIQIIMLVVGVFYAYRLLNLGAAGMKFGMHPEALVQWRAYKKRQYVWGIAAGWGSLVLGLGALFIVTAATRQCVNALGYNYCASNSSAANVWMILVTFAVLIVGIILSVMANNKAKALERTGMNPNGAPMAQPGWGQPPVQPGWGQPPAAPQQPGWGQPPTPPAPPAWGAPAASPTAAPADNSTVPTQPNVAPTDAPVA